MRKQSPFRVFIAITLMGCVFLSACEMPATTASAAPGALPTCDSGMQNPYQNYVPNGANRIYQDYLEVKIGLEDARKEAFLRLGESVKHWSQHVDLARDDNRMIRVTITLVDPSLVQYIVLNHTLRNVATNTSFPTLADYQNTVNQAMTNLGTRKELLFLVTITSTAYVSQPYGPRLLTATIPFENAELISTSDIRVIPSHDDHNLSEQIVIDNGPVFGYISFPLSVMYQGNCVFIMDDLNTTLTLETKSAKLGDKEFEILSWTFPYKHIMSTVPNPTVTVVYSYDKFGLITPESMQPASLPPTPIWSPNASANPNDTPSYYQHLAQYLWYLIMLDPTH